MEVHRGVWRHGEVHRWVYGGVGEGVQRNTGCTEVHTVMCRGAWRCTVGAQRWVKVHSGVLKCKEECIGLQRGAQMCVEVYRGY